MNGLQCLGAGGGFVSSTETGGTSTVLNHPREIPPDMDGRPCVSQSDFCKACLAHAASCTSHVLLMYSCG